MTQTVVPILTDHSLVPSDSASTMVGDVKKTRRCVCFKENVATVVAHIDLGKPGDTWYSKLELKLFKEKAKALSDHFHTSQPMLAGEIVAAHAFTRAHKNEGSDELFAKWHKLSSGRRGLERFVLDKQTRQDHSKEVRASRTVVLNLQCLFRRSAGDSHVTDQQADIIHQQYTQFARSAAALAHIYAVKDAATVRPFYEDHHDELDDKTEEEFDDDILLNDGVLSVGSCSLSSRSSMSAKKVKRRSDKESSSRRRKSSSKKASKKSGRTRSPRRIRSLDSTEDHFVAARGA